MNYFYLMTIAGLALYAILVVVVVRFVSFQDRLDEDLLNEFDAKRSANDENKCSR